MRTWTAETEGYDDERIGFQQRDPHRPARIFGVTSTADVREAVRYARDQRLRLAVQASGHGHLRPTDGVLISTRRFNQVTVDPERRTATIRAGATWQQVIDATAPHGLAPLSGSLPGVGAVSYTLGGGIGLMARYYGYAADHVRRIELVTPAGEVVDAQDDLFWALRGGGGNFGVVTELEVDLFPVTTLYGGSLHYDLQATPDALDTWREWTATIPDEVTSGVSVVVLPDAPFIPEPLRGKHVAQLQVSILGDDAVGEDLLRPLRALGEPLIDTVGVTPYVESGRVFAEPEEGHPYRSRNVLLDQLDPAALATVPKLAGPEAPVMVVVNLRQLGGALARPPAIPNAVGNRDARYSLTILSPVDDDVTDLHSRIADPWGPFAVGRMLSFSYSPLDEDEIGEVYEPADLERLRRIRDRVDPDRLLLPNQPI